MRNRGYYGIGIYQSKFEENVGTLWRSAQAFGADFIFTVGDRKYRKQVSDTSDATKHVPLFHFESLSELERCQPQHGEIVCVEITDDALELQEFYHPERAIYLLGAEDIGLPAEFMKGKKVVKINSGEKPCLNVAVAGSLVLYDRSTKRNI